MAHALPGLPSAATVEAALGRAAAPAALAAPAAAPAAAVTNMDQEKKNKLCCDPKDMHPVFAVKSQQHGIIGMIVCYGDFSRIGLTGFKFEVKIWTRIGRSCLGLLRPPADQNNASVEHQRRRRKNSNINEENKQVVL